MMVSQLALVYGAYLLATASPGPSNMAIMGVAMRDGRRPALVLAARGGSGGERECHAVAGLRRTAVAKPSGQQRQRRLHLALLTFNGHHNDNGAGMPAPFLFAAAG